MENKDKITDVPNNNIKENNNPNLQSQEQKIGTPGIERASFSQIFNVASEEQPLEQSKVEIPKIDLPEMKQQPPREKKEKVFNDKERLLYEIKPEKEGNPIVVVCFFIILLSAIFALPYISKKITYEVFKNIPIPKVEEKEPEFYYFNKSSVRAKFNQLEFTNFVKIQRKGEEKIRFTINNASEKAYQFDKKYYIVFYNNDLVVYRALVHSYEAIGSSSTLTIELPISKKAYSDANRFKIEEIVEEKYTPVKLVEEDGDYQVMTCNYNADEIKYYFIDGKLSKIKETYKEESKNNPNYQENLLKYKVLSQEYKKIPNFQSTFVEYATSFTMINNFSHKDIEDKTLSDLKTYKFFKYNETKEVVSFEIEAQGYNCS